MRMLTMIMMKTMMKRNVMRMLRVEGLLESCLQSVEELTEVQSVGIICLDPD